MRITIDIPDDLYSQIKAKASREGCTLQALVIESLKRVVAERPTRRTEFPLIKSSGTGAEVTAELVQQAEAEYYEQEARRHVQFMRRS